jgi:hypothetical protein
LYLERPSTNRAQRELSRRRAQRDSPIPRASFRRRVVGDRMLGYALTPDAFAMALVIIEGFCKLASDHLDREFQACESRDVVIARAARERAVFWPDHLSTSSTSPAQGTSE